MLMSAAAAGAWAYRQHHRYKHWAVHQPGMVYRSAWLEPDVMSEVIEEHQIRTVVNLCTPGEMGEARWEDERRAVTGAGARLIELEMPTTIDADDPAIARHLEILADPDNYPLLVHCQHGVTRTAKFLAIYDVAYRDMTGEESLSAQPLFGREHHNVHVQAFVRNFEQAHEQLYPQAAAERLDVLRR
ncbi:MAG: fused DSP-PTPase phosphatase/NAD kinase-like protein [Planctomycetaceae bacterium]